MKRWLIIGAWGVFIIGIGFLLSMVKEYQDNLVIAKPLVTIDMDEDNAFLTEDELLRRLEMAGLLFEGQQKSELKVDSIEAFISGISQVKSTKVYTQIGKDWKIEIGLRKPIARVFNKYQEDFYIDDEGCIMETSGSYTSRVMVVSGEISDRLNGPSVPDFINNDSLISIQNLDEIYRISNYVCYDPLMCSLIGQLHREKSGDFVLVPLVGDSKIVFGEASSEEEVEEKFEKLRIFYEEALPSVGWDKYSEINLKYKDQVVCKLKNPPGE